ncbi:hypothetical protein [Microbacterium sp.]|uniref:hypothetical protein n=1 Tax=Microbacterium sp. TaxID=51671 RepID=UPI0039E30E76
MIDTGTGLSSAPAHGHASRLRDLAAVITLWIRIAAVAIGLPLAALYVLSGRPVWAIVSTAVLVAASSWFVWLARAIVARRRV